ncbi:MAG: DUF1127 domain-containing protein [Alphaproteobacteria bacterium]
MKPNSAYGKGGAAALRPHLSVDGGARRGPGLFRRAIDALAAHLERRRAVRHLRTLPPYLQRDVGLTEDDIERLERDFGRSGITASGNIRNTTAPH